jgi:microcystin-dependent protein
MTVTVVSGHTREDTFPIGTIMAAAVTSVPSGWLACDGSQKPIASYQTLYNILTSNGTVFPFGANVGSNFVLPNLDSRMVVAPSTVSPPAGFNSNVGVTVGASTHSHTGNVNSSAATVYSGGSGIDGNTASGSWTTNDGGAHDLSANIGAVGGNVSAGANGNLGTSLRGHLHANNGNSTTTSGHSHNHGYNFNYDGNAASGSLNHSHAINVANTSITMNASTLRVADTIVRFMILATSLDPLN